MVSILEKIYDWYIDMSLNVKTSKCVKLNEHDNIINFMYEPSPYIQLKEIFDKYPPNENDHLIDFGCGKGRVLIMAAKYGCKNLYGIDISSCLLDVAKDNLEKCKEKNPEIKFELYCDDAKKYVFDYRINKVFFFNPFQLRVFLHIFNSLSRSLEEYPREVTVYFCGASESTIQCFEKLGKFKLIWDEKEKGIYIYVSDSDA